MTRLFYDHSATGNRKVTHSYGSCIENRTPHTLIFFREETPAQIEPSEVDKYKIFELPSQGHIRIQQAPQKILGKLEVYGIDAPASRIPIISPQEFTATVDWDGRPPEYDGSGDRNGIIVAAKGSEALAKIYDGHVFVPDLGPESAVRDSMGHVLGIKRLEKR